jgi:hypothetical protein
MEALYAGHLNGQQGYDEVMTIFSKNIRNTSPIAPTEPSSTGDIYGGDIYHKGAWVLHTLRYVIGDDAFFKSLQQFLYPDPALKNVTDGSQCRLVSTDEFIETVEQVTNQKLDWFFQVYVRQAKPPLLQIWLEDNTVHLVWKTENDILFPIDVPVQIGDNIFLADMSTGRGAVTLDPFVPPQVDPDNRILKQVQRINVHADENSDASMHFSLEQNYPNPFNAETTIEFTLPRSEVVEITIHNLRGEIIKTITNEEYDSGTHRVIWEATDLPSGSYTYKIKAGDFVDLKKSILLK